mgnify:CR=1 FL=1
MWNNCGEIFHSWMKVKMENLAELVLLFDVCSVVIGQLANTWGFEVNRFACFDDQ